MKLFFTRLASLLVFICIVSGTHAQQNFFSDIPESAAQKAGGKRTIVPEKYRTLRLDTAGLLPFLRMLPSEQNVIDRNNTPVLALPMPDGSVAKFHVWESSIMEPGLAAAFPELKTFTGQGIDDRTATIKLDWTEFGFHAMVLSPVTGQIFIDPYANLSLDTYISYYKSDYKKKSAFQELPPIKYNATSARPANANQILSGPCVGSQLRTYRLAVACTGEYAVAATGVGIPTKSQTLAKVVTSVARVNGIFETEFSIRMVLIANDTAILFTAAASDPFTGNNDAGTLIDESQAQIDSRIGNANYDIGHTFSTGTAGLAGLGVVCVSGFKASGVTGIANPVGDSYDVDFVAHEIGHQFGSNHSFNNANACGSTAADQNAEPGSGVTIMGYAGVCGNDNIAQHSIPYFHAVSFDQISPYVSSSDGATCAVITNTGNTPPAVNAGSDYIIPFSTPFILTGSATDANGDAITYSWEQVDVGAPYGASSSPSGNAPLFRSFVPVTTGVRYFPKLSDVIGNTATLGERLPSYARSMKFRLTARDNRAGGGGVCFDENNVTVANTGPFTVTSPSASAVTWYVNDFQTVTWNPGGTAAAPVNCANVTIQLSTDGGNTFPTTLLASTPNDGSAEIQVPNSISTTVRIRVMAVGNIFYDISNTNFRIQAPPSASFALNTPDPVSICGSNSGSVVLKTAALGAFLTPINLSAGTLPPGTTLSFDINPVSPGDNATITLNNTSGLAAGTYTVTITGIAGAVTKTRDIQFLVAAGIAAPAGLITPANDTTGKTVFPTFSWQPVSGATSYQLELSTASDFSAGNITYSNIAASQYSVSGTPLDENTIYYWRVRAASSCVGSPSGVYRFRTWLNTCRTSADVPKAISSAGTPSVTSIVTIPAAAGVTINDLNVRNLIGTHTNMGDLTFTLTGPNNASVVLLSNVCSGTQNFSITFDDQAALATIPCPPAGGIIRKPANPLSVFNGINSAGTWTLTIADNANNNGGSLTGWGLNINGTSATGCSFASTPLAITYTFTGTGNWNVASNWSSNVIPPNPLPSGSSIVINHSAGGNCTLNVSQTIATGATLTVMTGKNLIVPGALTVQ